jgi:hypothetical protein
MKLKEITNTLRFNGTELTKETIQETLKWFYDNALGCIEEVKSGKVKVNDPESYFKWRTEQANEYKEGNIDISVTFLQRAYYIQTGESVALLP